VMILLYVSHTNVCDAVCFTGHFHNTVHSIEIMLVVLTPAWTLLRTLKRLRSKNNSHGLHHNQVDFKKKGPNLITIKVIEASLRTHCHVQKNKTKIPSGFLVREGTQIYGKQSEFEGKKCCVFSVYLACLTRAVKSRYCGQACGSRAAARCTKTLGGLRLRLRCDKQPAKGVNNDPLTSRNTHSKE